MKVFKNPVVALILAIVIVVGSTLVNVHWKFGPLCREVTDPFFASGGIADQLENIREDADKLASVAEANGIDAKALKKASGELQRALSQKAPRAGELFRYYEALQKELNGVEKQLLGIALDENDAKTVSDCLARIHTASGVISASSYNESVRDFLAEYDRFPTRILAELAGLNMPEAFA